MCVRCGCTSGDGATNCMPDVSHQSAHDCVTWTLPVRWPPRSCTFHVALRAALVMPRNIAPSVLLAHHHRKSLHMRFQAHSHCRFGHIALHNSSPHACFIFPRAIALPFVGQSYAGKHY